jgi:hypothetical protein
VIDSPGFGDRRLHLDNFPPAARSSRIIGENEQARNRERIKVFSSFCKGRSFLSLFTTTSVRS